MQGLPLASRWPLGAGAARLTGAADVGPGEVVALVGGEHELGVGGRDAVVGQPLEERRERRVVRPQVLLVAGVARARRGAACSSSRVCSLPPANFFSCASEM